MISLHLLPLKLWDDYFMVCETVFGLCFPKNHFNRSRFRLFFLKLFDSN